MTERFVRSNVTTKSMGTERRALVALLTIGLTSATQTFAQSQASSSTSAPAFEVASVKPSKPGANGGGIRPMPGGQTYVATNVPLKLMIKLMYHLNDEQLSGGPNWMNTDLYDVEAKADHPANIDQLHVMFQNLLVDRFKLQFHHETKEMPVYALVVDKAGAKMKRNESPETFDIPIQPAGRGKMEGRHVSMSYLTWFLSQMPAVNRPVLDKSGLNGFYDFTLEWTPEKPLAPGADQREGPPMNPEAPDLFTALREQLGLKLEATKGPVEVMVIDHAEKPSEN